MAIINGTASNDTLTDRSFDLYSVLNANWSAGEDQMYGGFNNDTYHVNSAGDRVFESAGQGIDTVVSRVVSFALPTHLENLVLDDSTSPQQTAFNGVGNAASNAIIGNSRDNILAGLGGDDTLFGNGGNDTLLGGNGIDMLDGGIGDDLLDGGEGIDTLMGGNGNDTVYGGVGLDTLFGNDGFDVLYGDAGNDTLDGGNGQDQLTGGADNDELSGGNDSDWLQGSAGNDILLGGNGQDQFIFGEAGAQHADMMYDFRPIDDTVVLLGTLDAGLPGAVDPGILGLAFVGGDTAGNTLSGASFFKGFGFTGELPGAASGVYVNIANGQIWYNPTTSIANDALLLGSVSTPVAMMLGASDFVYGG